MCGGLGYPVLVEHYLDGVVGAGSARLGVDDHDVAVLDGDKVGFAGRGGVPAPETEGVLVFHVDRVSQ